MNALFCAVDKKEFHRVSSCESANEIWHKFEVVYEGTNQVKESKISKYTRQYELFQMEQNESVYSMYTRFTDIVHTLGAQGKIFSNSEKVKKIIRSLPKEWRSKRTAIEEAKDLNTLPLDDLIDFLISYEEDLAAEKGHEEKKKSIALKTSKYESDGESEPDDEELAILARRFRKFFKKTGERRNFRNFKNQREKKEVITCYEYKKPGHIRSKCPLINKLKKKAMVVTWDDSEEDSSDEEGSQEVSNLALMAIGGDDDLNEGLKKKKNKWYLHSGCSRHMTGNYAWFSSFTKIENGGDVSFEDNSKGKILGIRNVGKVSSTLIENKDHRGVLELSTLLRVVPVPSGLPLRTSRASIFPMIPLLSDSVKNSWANRSQLLPFQVRILHIILQHMVTPRQGHTDEVTRLDVGLLDSLIRRRVPITEPVYLETRKLGREIISVIKFFKKRGKSEKTISSKNEDTLLAPEDDRMLNDVYSEDKLPDFCLGARPRVPRRAAATSAAAVPAAAALAAASAAASSQDDEPAEPVVPPAASTVTADRFQ
ncbi:hypothetical protein KPL71_014169 [Citrus sinensis]|uniref:Uncharacterized protein n=1 Tax=Citrus sinensis TaxID=2711 RepID=A0ACB8KA33_CITSI|nr:hypothetical protein KPL71_014169 [Citrus sinensis]